MENGPQQLKQQMMSYLLGELNEQERERLEELYFNDNDAFLNLLETEDLLINEYLSNHLANSDRQLFELNYLSNYCRRQKLEFTYLLRQSEERPRIMEKSTARIKDKPSWYEPILLFLKLNRALLGIIAAAASIIIVGAVTWLTRDDLLHQNPTEIARMSTQTPFVQNGATLAGQPVVSLELTPGSQRSASDTVARKNTARIGPGTQLIELQLRLTGHVYRKYKGHIQKIDDGIKEILSEDSLEPVVSESKKVVVWKVEAAKLQIGDYQVELHGVKDNGEPGDVNSYDFSVREK